MKAGGEMVERNTHLPKEQRIGGWGIAITPIQPPTLLLVQTVIKPEVREKAAFLYPPTSAFQTILQSPSPAMTSDVFHFTAPRN